MVRTGLPPTNGSTLSGNWAAVSGRKRPTRSRYFGSSAFGPWHGAHFSSKTPLPIAAVPLPGGRPRPSGGMVRSQALISSAVGARPTPYVGIWAATIEASAMTETIARAISSRDLRIGILDAAAGRDLPALNRVVVIDRVEATDLDQLRERRLDVAGVVG